MKTFVGQQALRSSFDPGSSALLAEPAILEKNGVAGHSHQRRFSHTLSTGSHTPGETHKLLS